jgi:light-regulated signal transduction histidine kinase (bacteriophytochrome)
MEKKNILIVEDEGVLAFQLALDLERMGHTVAGIYASGEEALQGMETARPDLVLIDIKLQGEIDGIETAGHMHQRYGIPIIFMTAHSEESTIERAKLTEPYGYLLKPINPGELQIAVEVAVYKSKMDKEKAQLTLELWMATEQLSQQVAELDAFAYSVSHDLRAPLRHMSGFMKLLQQRLKDYPDVETLHYMDMISEASEKMGVLIDNLLNFSRLGRSEMKKTKINLNSLVKEVIREIQEELKERRIRWEIDELPEVLGDQSLLKLVLVNLVSNAVKFTSTCSQSEIKIGCKDEGDKLTILISDNGVGFDMKYVDKLFCIFQRLHTQNEFEGTGIGLANVQRIISRHGGKVWAEGAVGQGATFYFTLPKIKYT